MRPSRITLVPHTHWDREWYAPFDEFRERLVSMMDTLLDLGDRGFPHFHLDGQTAMVDDYLAVRPEREAHLRRLAAEGKLSLGPWVTQMDEFLTSGESHVRNLEMGLARAREIATATEVGYLPDQFGHVGQMPQLLRNAGIECAVVWRGVPASIDRTAFWWEAPDGSRVATEYLAFGYSLGHDLHLFEDSQALADALDTKIDAVAPYLASDRMLLTVGSDHSGPDASLPARLTAAEPLLGGVTAAIGSLEDHVDRNPSADLPVWRGELRSSARAHLLPNVTSARAHQKRERGRVEALIERYAEPLAALVPRIEWPQSQLDRAWTLLLWNGAHDSVCGCSHDRVAEDVDARYAEARAIGESIADEALAALGRQVREPGVLRFNPSAFERDGVPGLGWRVEPAATEPRRTSVVAGVRDGWVEAEGIAFALRDEPDVGDLYNYCFAEPGQTASPPDRLHVDGGLVLAEWDGLRVEIEVVRREGEPFLRLDGQIRNERRDHRLRLNVRLAEEADGSIAGSPFELVERGLRSEGGELEASSSTWPARGVVLAGGTALFHEGVFEYEVAGRELAVTLLRCVGTISRESIPTRPWPAGPGVATPGAQMLGTTGFSIGIRESANREDLVRDWERFALPFREVRGAGGGALPRAGSLLDIGGDAVLSAVRRRAGSLEVRCWNASASTTARATIAGRELTLGPARIESVQLD